MSGLSLEGLIHGGAYFRNFTVYCKIYYILIVLFDVGFYCDIHATLVLIFIVIIILIIVTVQYCNSFFNSIFFPKNLLKSGFLKLW